MIHQEFNPPGRKYQVLPNFELCFRELRGLKMTNFRACMHSRRGHYTRENKETGTLLNGVSCNTLKLSENKPAIEQSTGRLILQKKEGSKKKGTIASYSRPADYSNPRFT